MTDEFEGLRFCREVCGVVFMSDFVEFDLSLQPAGKLRLLRVVSKGEDIWGVCASLRGTVWERMVEVVHGESLSHALHGWVLPLLRELGPQPSHRINRIAFSDRRCKLWVSRSCGMSSDLCYAGGDPPECFQAQGFDLATVGILRRIVLGIKEERYTIVVMGDEFVI